MLDSQDSCDAGAVRHAEAELAALATSDGVEAATGVLTYWSAVPDLGVHSTIRCRSGYGGVEDEQQTTKSIWTTEDTEGTERARL
jgi:hypothetical protein